MGNVRGPETYSGPDGVAVSKMAKGSVQDFKEWFAKGPKHLGDVTKREMGQSHREGFVQ